MPLMGAAGFLALQRALHDGLRDVEHEGQFQRGDQLGVERAAVVFHRDRLIALLQLGELVGRLGQRDAVR